MPEITVTETQRERLETVRSELAAAYIDTYGHLRTEDAVEYLLDTYTPPSEQSADVAYERIATAEFPVLQRVAADVESVPGSGIDTETMRGELLSALGVEEFATRLADLDETEDGDGSAASADDESAPGSDEETESDAPGDADEESEDASDDADDSADTGGESGDADDTEDTSDDADDTTPNTGGPGAGGDSSAVLSAANRLLSEHDDKWREGSDEPYEVDLPDGTTEKVRTKDDIRGLLFKHY